MRSLRTPQVAKNLVFYRAAASPVWLRATSSWPDGPSNGGRGSVLRTPEHCQLLSAFSPILYFADFLGDDPYLVAAGKGLDQPLANCFGVLLRGETQLRIVGPEER